MRIQPARSNRKIGRRRRIETAVGYLRDFVAGGRSHTAPTGSAPSIHDHPGELIVSAISAFEIGIKHRKGCLDLGMEPETWWTRAVRHHGLRVLSVTAETALDSTNLSALHSDLCDRIIIATAERETAFILTSDALIRQYPSAKAIW